MNCQKNTCVWLSIVIGIIAGVLLGILYSQGIIPIGIIFWFYLAFGVLGLLLYPLYTLRTGGCFCNYKGLILTATIGSIVSSIAGQILFFTTAVTALAVLLGIATFFAFMQATSLVCLLRCHCND